MSSNNWRAAVLSRHAELKNSSLWRERRLIGSAQQPLIESDGQWLTNFSSNDYLGLAAHPKLARASRRAGEHWGVGAGASHLVCGHQAVHQQLEEELADFVGAERAVLFSNGYMANLALNTAFTEKNDLLLHDKLNHASLIDGARLSAAHFRRYAHTDVSHAQRLVLSSDYRRLMLVTDAVFSMSGNVAPISQLMAFANQQRALFCVDDAHGFGVLGLNGCGSLSHYGQRPEGNTLMMATLSKALGCYGAFVAGDALFIEHLIQSARSYIYTTALPVSVVSAALRALAMLKTEHSELHDKLTRLTNLFKETCQKAGIELLPSQTPIQAVMIGDEAVAIAVSEQLEAHGFLVPAIRVPTVMKGQARLRVTLTSAHTEHQVIALVDAIALCIGKQACGAQKKGIC